MFNRILLRTFVWVGLSACLISLLSCKRAKQESSQVQTISDRGEEDLVRVKGKIRLPSDENSHLLHWILSNYSPLPSQSSPTGRIYPHFEAEFSSPIVMNARMKFLNATPSYPIVTDKGHVQGQAIRFWIAKQLEYLKPFFDSKGRTPSMGEFKIGAPSKVGEELEFDYEAELRVFKSNDSRKGLSLAPGLELEVPLNPVTVMNSFLFGKGKGDIPKSNEDYRRVVRTYHDQIVRLQRDQATSPNGCLTRGAVDLAPSEFHRFLKPQGRRCSGRSKNWDSTKVTVKETRASGQKTAYPEYDRLFGGRDRIKIKILHGGSEAELEQFVNRTNGLLSIMELEENYRNGQLHGMLGKRNVLISLAARAKHSMFRQDMDIGQEDIVIACGKLGEAGEQLASPKTYEEGPYRIIALSNSDSYLYGMSEVLLANSLGTSNVIHGAVDVVSGMGPVTSCMPMLTLIKKFFEASRHFEDWEGNQPGAKEKLMGLSWIEILKEVNSAAERVASNEGQDEKKGYYAVGGEEGNQFGEESTIPTPSEIESICMISGRTDIPVKHIIPAVRRCGTRAPFKTQADMDRFMERYNDLCARGGGACDGLTMKIQGADLEIEAVLDRKVGKREKIALLPGSELVLNGDGSVKQFVPKTPISLGEFNFAERSPITLHLGGGIVIGVITNEMKFGIGGAIILHPYTEAKFDKMGRLWRAHVFMKEFRFEPKSVNFYNSGIPESVYLHSETDYGGYRWAKGPLELHRSGKPKKGRLAGDKKISNDITILASGRKYVVLGTNGDPLAGKMQFAPGFKFRNAVEPSNGAAELYSNGLPKNLPGTRNPMAAMIQGKRVELGIAGADSIRFHENGKIQAAAIRELIELEWGVDGGIAETCEFPNGKARVTLEKGTQVRLEEGGQLREATCPWGVLCRLPACSQKQLGRIKIKDGVLTDFRWASEPSMGDSDDDD